MELKGGWKCRKNRGGGRGFRFVGWSIRVANRGFVEEGTKRESEVESPSGKVLLLLLGGGGEDRAKGEEDYKEAERNPRELVYLRSFPHFPDDGESKGI